MRNKIIILAAFVFISNLIWEALHSTLYICNMNGDFVYIILRSSVGDVFLIGLIFLFISLKNMNTKWINKPSRLDLILIAIVGILTAIIIEMVSLSSGRWEYEIMMPTILGIGITPIFQLAITAIISLWLINKIR